MTNYKFGLEDDPGTLRLSGEGGDLFLIQTFTQPSDSGESWTGVSEVSSAVRGGV